MSFVRSSIKSGILPRPSARSWRRIVTREQELSAECAREARRQAALLPPGPVRDALLEKARQYELALQTDLHHDAKEPPLGSR